jgi:hypothetical protein
MLNSTDKMVQTQHKTATKSNPIVAGCIGRLLEGNRSHRRSALRAIERHRKQVGRACTWSTALKTSIYEDSKWATPPDYKMSSVEESPPHHVTTRNGNQRGNKPTCLVFTQH